MKADNQLREDVLLQLAREPSLDETLIAVSVVDGIVTLSGEAGSFGERCSAERAAERAQRARGVADELEIRGTVKRSDTDVAKAAADALSSGSLVPAHQVKVEVRDGRVTLRGEVSWSYQRQQAERAVRNMVGVKGITNLITVKPSMEPGDVQHRVGKALRRTAGCRAPRVKVEAIGNEVILSGTVGSLQERRSAEVAAWATPGVSSVKNYITVTPGTDGHVDQST